MCNIFATFAVISGGNCLRLMFGISKGYALKVLFGTVFVLNICVASAQRPITSNQNRNQYGTLPGLNNQNQNQMQYGSIGGVQDNDAPEEEADMGFLHEERTQLIQTVER